jgi:hypothetical protein
VRSLHVTSTWNTVFQASAGLPAATAEPEPTAGAGIVAVTLVTVTLVTVSLLTFRCWP